MFFVESLLNKSIMKKLVLPLLTFTTLGTSLFAQTTGFKDQFAGVRNELVGWDKVRGEWLAQSMEAMSTNQQVPDRNFPEKFTPSEMYMAMPSNVRDNVQRIVMEQTNGADSSSRQQWNVMNQFVRRPNCSPVQGRTYGDPHLTSFDGANYSFQTVGEFTLVKSQSGHMNVQVRQRAEGESVSLNSAVAMWVNGDRVCYYASTFPDGNRSTPFRVDGQAVYIENGTYYLNHGGIISATRNDYIITWPTGERVKLDRTAFGTGDFVNVAVEIYPCIDSYSGILGNANGRQNDDFTVNGREPNGGVWGGNDQASQTAEREYLSFLARDFGSYWRINQPESLFDYGFGQSTATFTDIFFPSNFQTIGDLPQTDRDRARRNCERQGFTGPALNACIYDNGFLNIPPTPQPTVPVVTSREPITSPVTNPVPNVNPSGRTPINMGSTVNPQPPVNTGGGTNRVNGTTEREADLATPQGPVAQPIGTNPNDPGNGTTVKDPTVRDNGGVVTTKPKEPNPYEPPVEPEKKPIRINRPVVNDPAPSTSTPSTSTPRTNSGSSSSGSSGSSGGSSPVRTSPEPTYRPEPTPKPVYKPEPTPQPVSRPEPKPVSTPAPKPASTPTVTPKSVPAKRP